MSYLWLWISILHAAIRINNQSAVSRALLIVSVCAQACVCAYQHVLCISIFYFYFFETEMILNKFTPQVSSMTSFHGC